MPSFLQRIAKKPVPADLLKAALVVVDELPEEQRKDFTGRTLAIIRLLEDQRPEQDVRARSDLLTGIQFRLEALARLRHEPAYRAWSMKTKAPGVEYIHEDLIDAAAIEPLSMGKREARFEPRAFFRRVLQITEARGRA
jgi:hypothetical protein